MIGTLAVDGCAVTFSTARRGLHGRATAPRSPLLTVPNVTAHLSTASVPTSYYYAPRIIMPARRKEGNKRCFCLFVCSSVAYIAYNWRTQRPSTVARPNLEGSFPLWCDSDTSFKVKRSKVRVRDRRGHTMSANLAVTLFVRCGTITASEF